MESILERGPDFVFVGNWQLATGEAEKVDLGGHAA